jgi:hypothetical protein
MESCRREAQRCSFPERRFRPISEWPTFRPERRMPLNAGAFHPIVAAKAKVILHSLAGGECRTE